MLWMGGGRNHFYSLPFLKKKERKKRRKKRTKRLAAVGKQTCTESKWIFMVLKINVYFFWNLWNIHRTLILIPAMVSLHATNPYSTFSAIVSFSFSWDDGCAEFFWYVFFIISILSCGFQSIDFDARAPYIPMNGDEDLSLLPPSTESLLTLQNEVDPG